LIYFGLQEEGEMAKTWEEHRVWWKSYLRSIRGDTSKARGKKANVEEVQKSEAEVAKLRLELEALPKDESHRVLRRATRAKMEALNRLHGRRDTSISILCSSDELADRIRDLEERGFEVNENYPVLETGDSRGIHQRIVVTHPESTYQELMATPGVSTGGTRCWG
jgi:hypothetical protein